MSKSSTVLFSVISVLILSYVAVARRADSDQPDAIVRLQPSSPGIQQIGNVHVSGVIKATSLDGDGSSIIGLSATNISSGTLDLARLSMPFALSGSSDSRIIGAENTSAASGSSGLFGRSSASSGVTLGVFGQSDSGGAGASAVYGQSTATVGTTFGGRFESSSMDGRGVSGLVTANDGVTYGGHFQTTSMAGRAVFGIATATSGNPRGGQFESVSSDGFGVRGLNNATTGQARGGAFISSSTEGRALIGSATASTGTNYGVIGETLNPAIGWGLFAFGRVGATGVKPFRIDHPFDPLNKYLLHYSAEGPEPLNIYSGNVVTDTNGDAWVQLPAYFDEINADFRYSLTVVEDTDSLDFVQAKIAREVVANRFKIRTSMPNVKVSWEVKGVRNDLWVRKYGASVEVDKEGIEKGKYQHPELYGLGPERGMNFDPESTKVVNARK